MRANQAIEVMHKYGKSFYWASFFLGKKHTYNAAVLYEFCRFLDDLADRNEKIKLKDRRKLRLRLPQIRICLSLASETF